MSSSIGDDTLSEVVMLAVEYKLHDRSEDVKRKCAISIKDKITSQVFQEKADEIRKQALVAAEKEINEEQVRAVKETLREGVVVGIAVGLLVNELSFIVSQLEAASGNKILASLFIIAFLSIGCFTLLLSDFIRRVSEIVDNQPHNKRRT